MIPTPLRRALGRDLVGALADDIRATRRHPPALDRPPVTDTDLAPLPEVVQRYLRRMGAVGLPPVATIRAHARGRFRMRPGGRALSCTVHQYSAARPVTRLLHMRLDAFGAIPMVGTDRYVNGEGHMLGKLFGLIPMADGCGPEFDVGELTTFLDDDATPVDFSSTDRFAVWHLPDGDFTYAQLRFHPYDIDFDV